MGTASTTAAAAVSNARSPVRNRLVRQTGSSITAMKWVKPTPSSGVAPCKARRASHSSGRTANTAKAASTSHRHTPRRNPRRRPSSSSSPACTVPPMDRRLRPRPISHRMVSIIGSTSMACSNVRHVVRSWIEMSESRSVKDMSPGSSQDIGAAPGTLLDKPPNQSCDSASRASAPPPAPARYRKKSTSMNAPTISR